MAYIKVGSRAFFEGYDDFHSKDYDYVLLVDRPVAFTFSRETHRGGLCIFEYKKTTPDEYLEKTREALKAGKFLVPAFVAEVGFTLDHLRQLAPLFEQLDEKHAYQRIIYTSYMTNNAFTLTDAQRDEAYASYKAARPEKKKEKEHEHEPEGEEDERLQD